MSARSIAGCRRPLARLAAPAGNAQRGCGEGCNDPHRDPDPLPSSDRSSLRSEPRCAAREARVERSDCAPLAGNLRSSGCREAGETLRQSGVLAVSPLAWRETRSEPHSACGGSRGSQRDPRPGSPVLSSGRSGDPGSRGVARRVHRRDPASGSALSGRAEPKPSRSRRTRTLRWTLSRGTSPP